jgi:parvulin-like peptidyl-prolyl isomerase
MMRTFIALAITTVLVSFATFARAQENTVLATVGDNKITLKDFNQRYDEVQKATINPPPKELFLEDLVRFELGVQEAMKLGVQNEPAVKERIRQEIYKGLLEKELGKKTSEIKVTEADMKAFYAKNPEIRTSHILIEFKPDATAEQKAAAKNRAKEIYDEVKKSKRPFEELVALYSDDVLSKKSGGDVGWQSSMTLVPSYYQAILKMKQGEVKGLIETQYGFHIVKVTGRHSYEDANKRQIRAAVFDEKRKIIFDEYFAKLKHKYKIEVNKAALK